MTKKAQRSKRAADKVVKNILRKTWHSYSSEEKIRIVLAGLRAKKVSQFCAVARGSQRACFTVGRRNFFR
jgi:transposase